MARMDAFLDMKKGNVKGESTEKGFEDCIQLLSWSEGVTNSGSSAHGTGAGVGAVNFQDFHFTMTMNKASTPLMVACCTGQHIEEVILTQRKSTGDETPQPFLVFTFKDVLVSSYQTGSSGAELPIESCSLNFSEVTMQYATQDAKGKLTLGSPMGWNVKTSKKAP